MVPQPNDACMLRDATNLQLGRPCTADMTGADYWSRTSTGRDGTWLRFGCSRVVGVRRAGKVVRESELSTGL
jgi:hypothetical protein